MNVSATTAATPGFVGWHRRGPGCRWLPVCRGYSEASVLQQLLTLRAGGDKVVLPAHRNPNDPRPRGAA